MKKCFKNLFVMFLAAFIFALGNSVCLFADENISPTESYTINNTILNFNKVVYIDSVSGNDTSGDGSEKSPFNTAKKAMDYLNSNKDYRISGAIIFKSGSYNIDSCVMGGSYNLNPEYNGMKVSWIAQNGDQGKVFIKSNRGFETLIVENNSSYRIKMCFYGLIFKDIKNDNNRMCLGGDDWTNEYYNCVFDNIGLGGWKGLVSKANVIMSNCLIYNVWEADGDQKITGKCENTASTNALIPMNGEKTNCLYKINIDSNYNITSDGWKNKGTGTNPDGTQANIGVYGGKFAWGEWKSNDNTTQEETIVNTAYAKGDNTNNAGGKSTVIFKGVADTRLSVTKTADVQEAWVGDTFNYTITVTNTGSKTAKSVVLNDAAPSHIDFLVDNIITSQGKVDPSSTSKNIVVNIGDIEPAGTVTIKIPVNVVL